MSAHQFYRFATAGRPWSIIGRTAIELVDEVLLDPGREFPVVAVSTSPDLGRCLVDPDRLARELRGHALVVVVPHGHESWVIANRLAPELAVFGGFARVWMPGLNRNSASGEHRRFEVYDEAGGDQVIRQIVLAVCHGLKPEIRRPPSTTGEGASKGVASTGGVHVPFDPTGPAVTELGWWSSQGA
ncbi:MAG: hypothetical protein R3F29_03630 [Planctomycetota bacterium]